MEVITGLMGPSAWSITLTIIVLLFRVMAPFHSESLECSDIYDH